MAENSKHDSHVSGIKCFLEIYECDNKWQLGGLVGFNDSPVGCVFAGYTFCLDGSQPGCSAGLGQHDRINRILL